MSIETFIFDPGEIYVLPEADTTFVKQKYLDVPYACASKFQTLDIYLPNSGSAPYPLIIFIHGGGWRRGDKRDIQLQGFLKLLECGYAIASINYRLSLEAIFPACIHDCKAAVRYLKAYADQFHVDAGRIAIAGGSAGGHLALLTALTPGDPFMEDLSQGNSEQTSSVRCAVALYPATDFLTMFAQAEENERKGIVNLSDNSRDPYDPATPEAAIFGKPVANLDSRYLQTVSPLFHISSEMPPILLQHGKLDYIIPCQQSIEFYQRATDIGVPGRVELDLLETAIHMDAQFQSDENIARIERFLSKYLV